MLPQDRFFFLDIERTPQFCFAVLRHCKNVCPQFRENVGLALFWKITAYRE